MATFASGKYAIAISDRSGMQFPYLEMVREWTGAWVHYSEFEPKQPQISPRPVIADPQGLQRVRPARTAPAVTQLMPNDPFTTYASGSSYINVNVPNHGLTNGDTYRFVPCMSAGLAFYLSQKYNPQLSQQMKLYYEDELARALAEDGSPSSSYITPKAYFPSV